MGPTLKAAPDILVVDDIPANIAAMKNILKNMDVHIVEATGGNQALALTLQHDFALVLLDVQMPDMNGYEVAEFMRNAEHSRHIPIIFVTANSREEMNELKGYDAGAVDYITKPINKTVLRSKIRIFCDLYRTSADLKIARAEAEMNARYKSEFLSNMSHELRTPMHAILNYASIGLKNTRNPDPEKIETCLGNIQIAGKRLLGLLNNLLDLSKLEARKMEFTCASGDFSEVAEHTLIEIDSLLKEKNIRTQLIRETSYTQAYFDQNGMIQVMINVLSNAIKFSPAGSVITIRLSTGSLDIGGEEIPCLQCAVEDEGVGIPENELKAVFDKFVQSSKTKSNAGGTGLGLAICHEIIAAHGGAIWAESGAAKGAALKFLIPVAPSRKEGA